MKLGLGLYRHMLTRENFQYARQAGATHVIVHLVDYFKGGAHNPQDNQPTGTERGWGQAGDPNNLWSLSELLDLNKAVKAEGLKIEAIENFDPAHWHDVLLDGPKRKQQIENVKELIRRIGQAGIPVMGYNFSIAGVCGRTHQAYARGGGAMSVGMEGHLETPMPRGMVWNMVYDENAPVGSEPFISHEELWRRLGAFLDEVIPVAEEAGVKLALHPDDPPLPTMRGQPRLVYQPHLYQRVIALKNWHPVKILERAVNHVIVLAHAADAWVGVETGKDGIGKNLFPRAPRLGRIRLTSKPTPRDCLVKAFLDGRQDLLKTFEAFAATDSFGRFMPQKFIRTHL